MLLNSGQYGGFRALHVACTGPLTEPLQVRQVLKEAD